MCLTLFPNNKKACILWVPDTGTTLMHSKMMSGMAHSLTWWSHLVDKPSSMDGWLLSYLVDPATEVINLMRLFGVDVAKDNWMKRVLYTANKSSCDCLIAFFSSPQSGVFKCGVNQCSYSVIVCLVAERKRKIWSVLNFPEPVYLLLPFTHPKVFPSSL